MSVAATCVVDARAEAGESPIWSPAEGALYWVDIWGRRLHRYDPGTRSDSTYPMPDIVTFAAPHEAGGMIVCLRSSVWHVDLARQTFHLVVELPIDHGARLNDATLDRRGRLWVGSTASSSTATDGALWRVDVDGEAAVMASGLRMPNGLAFPPDGGTLYLSDSHPAVRTIWAFDCESETGNIGARRTFRTTNDLPGRPDGACVDREGRYWMAAVDAWSVLCLDDRGTVVDDVSMPVEKPWKPAIADILGKRAVTESVRLQTWRLARRTEASMAAVRRKPESKPTTLSSLQQALSLVLGDDPRFGPISSAPSLSQHWFRGHANAAWLLAPGALRQTEGGAFLYDDFNMITEMRLARPEEARRCSTTMEWLVLVQHYGLPTRLLDWTESILVALYFAAQDDGVDGELIALAPIRLNRQTSLRKSGSICMADYPDAILRADQSVCGSFDELRSRLSTSFGRGEFYTKYLESFDNGRMRTVANLPVSVYPSRNNPRITAQSGMFTLHGGDVPSNSHRSDFGQPVSLDHLAKDDPDLLVRFSIPAGSKARLRAELSRLGVNHGSLFPELEYQARHIREKWMRGQPTGKARLKEEYE